MPQSFLLRSIKTVTLGHIGLTTKFIITTGCGIKKFTNAAGKTFGEVDDLGCSDISGIMFKMRPSKNIWKLLPPFVLFQRFI